MAKSDVGAELAQLREANEQWRATCARLEAQLAAAAAELEQLRPLRAEAEKRWPVQAYQAPDGQMHRVRAPNATSGAAVVAARLGLADTDLRWRGFTQA